MKKDRLFSVTAKDCEWDYYRGSGKGRQKRNKTSSAVRCRHLPSGAAGQAEDGRSQALNRQMAFARMAETKEFKRWVRIEAAKATGAIKEIKERLDRELQDPNITIIEIKDDKGRWTRQEDICGQE